jgi:GGDEF domain-containing protein
MISIKHFLENRNNPQTVDPDILEASLQAIRLLLDSIAANMVRGPEAESGAFAQAFKALVTKMDAPPSVLSLLELSSEAVEAIEIYSHRGRAYLAAQNEQMQSMVSMLAGTVADISGQTDVSIARLQTIEQQIEHASGLDDMRALSASLQSCLAAVREAATQQRKSSAATVGRLKTQIDTARKQAPAIPESSASNRFDLDLSLEPVDDLVEAVEVTYVAAFKLQRAAHIATRFGEAAKHEMLAMISQRLKEVLGPGDRLLRWKGTSFVMFLKSTAAIKEVRAMLSDAVGKTGQHYIEVGTKSALLAVGVDWIVFPQSQCRSLDAVFTEVETFLVDDTAANSASATEKQ